MILATVLIDAQLDGKKCSKEGESGRDCRGILKPVGKRLSRAGGIPCGSYLCERHRFRVLQEDTGRIAPGVRVHLPGDTVNFTLASYPGKAFLNI